VKAHAVPFPAKLAVHHKVRNRFMAECAKLMLPRLFPLPKRKDWLSIVCFGPTLLETWKEIKGPLLTVSGAHNFLVERGVEPDYHIDCDPRIFACGWATGLKPAFLPTKNTHYLMASCCDPQTWEELKDRRLSIWHMHNGPETAEWIKENDPWSMLIGGGSTSGLRAIQVGCLLGFSRFDIYGMDGNFVDGRFRAGESKGLPQNVMRVKVGEREFETTDLMLNAAVEYLYMVNNYKMIACRLHGDGMLKALTEFPDFKISD
jgi:hypothetical protein